MTTGESVIVCAAIKKQLGDTLETFAESQMPSDLCSCTSGPGSPSDGSFISVLLPVYGECPQHSHHRGDATPAKLLLRPGQVHFGSSSCVKQLAPAATLRCCSCVQLLIYGPGDQGGYGPTGFIKSAIGHEPIVLWGDALEKREFILRGRCRAPGHALTFHNYDGVLNIVSGRSYSFQNALEILDHPHPSREALWIAARQPKAKADHGFDNSRLGSLLPDASFTSLAEGIHLTLEAIRQGTEPAKV